PPAALQIDSQVATGVTITNSVFAHNRPTHPLVSPTAAVIATTAGATIRGNVFYDDEAPLAINGNSSLDDSNVFDHAGAQPSKFNSIFVGGSPALGQPPAAVDRTITWSATRVPFVLLGNATIAATGLLHLGDGVTMKFQLGTKLVID